MSMPYKTYKAQKNARKITLYSLAGAIVIVAGIYMLRTFLNRDTALQAIASPQAALEPIPQGQGIPLPGTAAAQAPSQSLAAQQQQSASEAPLQAPPSTQPAAPQAPAPMPAEAPASPTTSSAVATSSLSPDAAKLVAEANADLTTGKFIAARDKLNDAVRMLQGGPQQATVKTKLEQLSRMWLYGKDVLSGDTLTSLYTVRPGDSMEVIGKKFKVPYEFLMEINGITKPESLKVGQKLKVANGPFHAIVSKSTFTMDIYLQTTYVRTFKVGLGKEGMETPTGLWRAALGGKMIKPRWTDPQSGKTYEPDSPDYPLGSRWVGLDGIEGNAKGRKGFAIHGTKDPETIGTKSSQGCIRLFNGEAIMVYNMMMPGLSEVRVVD
jgi:lipoprotein-anchoring transpeptidase ErfK/SrfK